MKKDIKIEYECLYCYSVSIIQFPKRILKKVYSIDLVCKNCKRELYRLLFDVSKLKLDYNYKTEEINYKREKTILNVLDYIFLKICCLFDWIEHKILKDTQKS